MDESIPLAARSSQQQRLEQENWFKRVFDAIKDDRRTRAAQPAVPETQTTGTDTKKRITLFSPAAEDPEEELGRLSVRKSTSRGGEGTTETNHNKDKEGGGHKTAKGGGVEPLGRGALGRGGGGDQEARNNINEDNDKPTKPEKGRGQAQARRLMRGIPEAGGGRGGQGQKGQRQGTGGRTHRFPTFPTFLPVMQDFRP